MKNIILTLSLFLISTVGFAQKDTVRIKHTNYTTVFDKTKRYPVMVEWWVTKKMVSCPTPLKRKECQQQKTYVKLPQYKMNVSIFQICQLNTIH
jgi:hypothetical protein